MQVQSISIKDLILDPSNARIHDEKNLNAIKGSLAKFGQQKPIVINKENIIIAGNGTYAAAKMLGWEKIDCIISELGKTEQIAFALADNRTSDLSTFDQEVLGATLHALRFEDFDLNSIGFDVSSLDEIYKNDDEKELTDTFKPPVEFLIVINCIDEIDQKDKFDKLNEMGIECKIM